MVNLFGPMRNVVAYKNRAFSAVKNPCGVVNILLVVS